MTEGEEQRRAEVGSGSSLKPPMRLQGESELSGTALTSSVHTANVLHLAEKEHQV